MRGKKLLKSNNRKICGVCGGIAEYFGIDPFIVRLIWGVLALAWGTSIPIYIILAFVMDSRSDYIEDSDAERHVRTYNIEYKQTVNAEPVGFRYNNGVKEEIYR